MKQLHLGLICVFLILTVACLCPCRHFDPEKNGKGVALSSDGSEIVYEVKGKGDTAIVFVHGFSCDRSYFDNQMDFFATKYRVVAVDLAGHGASDKLRQSYTIELFADDVIAVIMKLQLKRVILVGHSMGGYVTLEVASKLQGKVIGLVTVDTLEDVSAKFPKKLVDNLLNGFATDYKGTMSNFVKSFFPKTTDKKLVDKIVNDMSAEPKFVAISALKNLVNYNNNKLLQKVESLNIPVYAINTDLNPTNEKANRKYFKEYNLVIMKGLSHFLMLEDSEGFNDILDGVISDLLQK